LDSPAHLALHATHSRHLADDAAHPFDGTSIRRHEAQAAFEQHQEEVLKDISCLSREVLAQFVASFFEKHRAHRNGDRAEGATVAMSGAPREAVEVVLELRIG